MPEPAQPRPTADLQTLPISLDGATETLHTGPAVPRPTSSAPRAVPEVIAGYRRVRQLGAGGMGEVHLAYHDRLNRHVALKLLRPNVIGDEAFAQRFLRESKAMAALSHPNVVAIHDAGEVDGFLYMALEYVEGTDLSKMLRTRGTIDEPTAVRIMIGCCRGLEAIERAGLVHRDIKPANIFLDRAGEPKIGDLGLARHTDGEDRMTLTGAAWGTPAYMPPEQLRGIADIDIRCDLYALGATLYTILTGSEPFTGATSFVVTSRILNEPAPDPRLLNRTISPQLAAIIRTCLEKDRDKRYADPELLRVDLERARDGLPLLHAQVLGGPEPATPAPASPLPGAQPRRTPIGGLPASGPAVDPALLKVGIYGTAAVVIGLVLYSLQGGTSTPAKTTLPTPATVTDPAPATQVSQPWMNAEGRDTVGPWAVIAVNGVRARMRHIPAGMFQMGSPAGEPGHQTSETLRPVTLTRPFWIAETEVTRGLWQAAQGQTADKEEANLPVDNISWFEAHDFTAALKHALPAETVVRLPSEAEWEYACRAGSTDAFAAGPAPDPKEWLGLPSDQAPRAVHQGLPNRFGLYDLHGNVREWCQDNWDGQTPPPAREEFDPLGQLGSLAVLRGGAWDLPVAAGRCAARTAANPQEHIKDAGLRFVIEDQ
jgi:serine/threonine-protein kinase